MHSNPAVRPQAEEARGDVSAPKPKKKRRITRVPKIIRKHRGPYKKIVTVTDETP